MTKVLTFKVAIEGLEEKIWRKIEITDKRTVAELAYTILATFDSLAYHLYDIKYKDKIYDCWVCIEDDHTEIPKINATTTKLSSIKIKENETMEMTYDYGSPTTFIITYISEKDMEPNHQTHYPHIIDGAGCGMVDDITSDELQQIVADTDKKGKSLYYFTPGYQRNYRYDYRNYSINIDNKLLKGKISVIKKGYEVK